MKLNSIALLAIAIWFGLAARYDWLFLLPTLVMGGLGVWQMARETDEYADEIRPKILRGQARWPGES